MTPLETAKLLVMFHAVHLIIDFEETAKTPPLSEVLLRKLVLVKETSADGPIAYITHP